MNPQLSRYVVQVARRLNTWGARFDPVAYVWRSKTGRELNADEVEAMGRDPGLRDITPADYPPRDDHEEQQLATGKVRWYEEN
jgi:hypothetical protein